MTGDINTAQWMRVREIFEAALELTGDDRDSFLRDRCGNDVDLRRKVERLIRALENNSDFLESPLDLQTDSDDFQPLDQRLGAYRLIRRLGSGGMGVVYLAERDDGHFSLRVAVKIVWPESSIPDTRERFANERQILADLDHPNISRLLDGGVTSEGLPYLVMEYVDGDRITSYAREKNLTVLEKLRLFREVCLAVAHAHAKRIVHRDIKPGNILVTREGRIKLLDFGIARVLQGPGESTDDPVGLKTGTPLLSLDYASPEQVRGEPVDTSSDLYSLGVVLYELIAGRLPYGVPSRSPLLMAKAITDDDPLPLERVDTPWMTRQVDTILKRALAKEVIDRYQTAAELAAEIEMVLGGQPVGHRQESRQGIVRGPRAFGAMIVGLLLLATLFLGSRYYAGLTATRFDRYIAAINEARNWLDKGRHQMAIAILNGLDREIAGFELDYLLNLEANLLEFEIGKGVDQSYLLPGTNQFIAVTEEFSELSRWDIATARPILGSIRRGRGIWTQTYTDPDQVFIVSLADGQLELEDYLQPGRRITCPVPGSRVIAVGMWNRLIHTVSTDGVVRVWQPAGCVSKVIFEAEAVAGGDYFFYQNLPILLLKSADSGLQAWNFETGKLLFSDRAPGGSSRKVRTPPTVDQVFIDEKRELLGLTRTTGSVEIHELATGRMASAKLDSSTFLQLYPDPVRKRLVILYSSGRVDQLSIDQSVAESTILKTEGEFTGGSLFDGGRYLAVSERLGRLAIYDLDRGMPVVSKQVDSISGNISIRLHKEERRLITSGSDGWVKFWDTDDLLRDRSVLLKSDSRINAVTISPDGQWIAAGGGDGRVHLWNSESLDREAGIIETNWEIFSLAFSPGSDELAVAGKDQVVQIWTPQDRRLVRTLPHGSFVHMVLYSPDGRSIATAGFDSEVRIHNTIPDTMPGATVPPLRHNGEVTSIVFTPDGREIVTAGVDGDARSWDLRSGKQTRRLFTSSKTIWSLAITPDGRHLGIIGDDPVPQIIDLGSGKVTALEAIRGGGRDLLFSQDGRRVFVANSRQSISIIDSATSREVLQLKEFNGNISSLALSTDGKLLVSGDLTGAVRIFRSNR
ncbi:MAG: protein kinase domain-containing protein [Blastocatellia bacterium]